jgi:DNA-binding transcriptional LysR family regulator
VAVSSDVVLERVLAHCALRHLQALLMVAETGSVQGTAHAMGITPSSLEQVLAQLDDMFEAELLRQEGDALRPTPACVALLPHAREVLRAVAGAAGAVVARSRPEKILVRVLATNTAARDLLERAAPAFQSRYARIEIQWNAAEDAAAAIARGELDLVVGARPASMPDGWEFRDLLTERFSVVCAPTHPLSWQSKPSWGHLSRHAWLLPETGSPARQRFDALLAQRGIQRVDFCVVKSVDDLSDWLLRDPDMLAFAPTAVLHRQLAAGELLRLRAEGLGGDAIGLLQPREAGAAVGRVGDFLQRFAAVPEDKPASMGLVELRRNAPESDANLATSEPLRASA